MRKRRWRKARREAIKTSAGAAINQQQVWVVTTELVELLPVRFKKATIRGLRCSRNEFWLRPRDGKALVTLLKAINVGYFATWTQFKRCQVCGRPTVGSDAVALRKQMEQPGGRELPCGPNCRAEAESRLWRKINELEATW